MFEEKLVGTKTLAATRLVKAKILEAIDLSDNHEELLLLNYLLDLALTEAVDIEARHVQS